MAQQDPLDEFLDKIDELIRVVKNSKFSEEEIPKELIENISFLEKLVDAMVTANETTLHELGVNEPNIHEALEKTQELASSNRRIMARIEKIKKETQAMQRQFSLATTLNKQLKKHTGKGKVVARQKKFRRMGNRQDWKPL